MIEDQLQLQISLNIGSQHYLIKVPKATDLSALVQQFLINNNLNPKLHASIVRLVQDKLNPIKTVKQQNILNKANNASSHHHGQQRHLKERQGKDNYQSVSNAKAKSILISKIKQELEEKGKNDNPPDSRKVYEQWKLMEKEKKKKSQIKLQKPVQTSRTAIQRETHSPDYFYRKGVKFQEECHKQTEEEFKKLYPFRLKDKAVSQKQQYRFCQKLSFHNKDPNLKALFQKANLQQKNRSQVRKMDPIKQHIRAEDAKIDLQIYKMIRQGSITPKKLNRNLSKSPFRRTIFN